MKHRTLVIGTLIAITFFDGILKYAAITSFPSERDPSLSPILALVLHKNPGITFDLALPFVVVAPVTLMIILGLAWHARTMPPRAAIGNIAIILGALNNFIDRIVNGFTTDYLMLFRTSIINLADVLIFFGAVTLLVYYKHNPHQQRA